jgi:hypothetical protein
VPRPNCPFADPGLAHAGVPTFDVADVQAGPGNLGDRVFGDEPGTTGVVAAGRFRPNALVDFLPGRQHVGDVAAGGLGSRAGLQR